MKRYAMPKHEYTEYLSAVAEYARSHPGVELNNDKFILTQEGKPINHILYQGTDYFTMLVPDDFTCPTFVEETGCVVGIPASEEAVVNIIKKRSDVDLKQADSGRYFLHRGAIEVYFTDGKFTCIWYGGADVTEHVGKLLILMKNVLK